jgi:hypothetical protein
VTEQQYFFFAAVETLGATSSAVHLRTGFIFSKLNHTLGGGDLLVVCFLCSEGSNRQENQA